MAAESRKVTRLARIRAEVAGNLALVEPEGGEAISPLAFRQQTVRANTWNHYD